MEDDRDLSFSERRRLAETGTLGEPVADAVPQPLRNALHYYVSSRRVEWGNVTLSWAKTLYDRCMTSFGWPPKTPHTEAIDQGDVDQFCDYVEFLVGTAGVPGFPNPYEDTTPIPTLEADLNKMFARHLFAYRVEGGLVRSVSSPLLDAEVTGPALLATKQPGWQKVEEDYREALAHQRAGEVGLAINSAHAAVESALKALSFKGASLSDLIKEFRKSPLARPYLANGLDQLTSVIGKLTPMRGEGEAHGQAPDANDPPPEFAAFAIHCAGAFIVFLSEAAGGSATVMSSVARAHG